MLDKNKMTNMRDVFDAIREARGNDTVVRYMKQHEVFEIGGDRFFEDIYGFESRLCTVAAEGMRVAIIGSNSYEWLITFYAALDMGAVPVLFAADYPENEIRETLIQTDAGLILYDEGCREKVLAAAEACSLPAIPMAVSGEKAEGRERPANHRQADEDALILFTSGTTGYKKAVVHSNRSAIASMNTDLLPFHFKAQLAILPFHHLAGYNPMLNTLWLGSVICLLDDMRFMFEAFEKMKPDYLFVVPSMAKVIAKRIREADNYGASIGWDLHLLGCGGADFPEGVLDILESKDIKMLQGYGASEMGGIGFSWVMDPEKPDTIGKTNDLMEIRIDQGELLVRSESVMNRYDKDPEGTKEILSDGWYRTGDLAVMDDKGYIYLTGRKKNLIILSNGENVSPEEIERHIQACADVAEVIVCREKDYLAAHIYPVLPEAWDEAAFEAVCDRIRTFIKDYNMQTVAYKKVTFMHFRNTEFEKNPMRKIIRERVKL